jgi:hypothetical protein
MRTPSDPDPVPPPPSDAGSPTAGQPPTTPGAAPATPGGPPPAAAGPATFSSKKLQDRKKNAIRTTERDVQTVEDKTFKPDAEGRWIDTAWDGKSETRKIEAFSDAYFQLLEKDERIARYLAVGERVVFVHDGRAYEVVTKGE